MISNKFLQVSLITPKSSTEIFEEEEKVLTKNSESIELLQHNSVQQEDPEEPPVKAAPEVKTKRLGSKRRIRKELPSIQEEYQSSNDVEVGSYFVMYLHNTYITCYPVNY